MVRTTLNPARAQRPALSRPGCPVTLALAALLVGGCAAHGLTQHHERASQTARDRLTDLDDLPPGPEEIRLVALAAGQAHVCGLDLDGQVLCWGSHDVGQLGDEALPMWRDATRTTRKWAPHPVPGIRHAVEISAGRDHTCARHLPDGALADTASAIACWGGGTPNPQPLGTDDAAGLASGAEHTCVVSRDGTLRCWGWREVLDASLVVQSAPTEAPTPPTTHLEPVPLDVPRLDARPVALLAAGHLTCAALDDGAIACWANLPGHAPRAVTLPDSREQDMDLVAMDESRLCTARQDGNHLRCWELGALDRAWAASGAPQVALASPVHGWIRPGLAALFLDTGRVCGIYDGSVDCELIDLPMPLRRERLPAWLHAQRDVVTLASAYGWGCMVDAAGRTRCWGEQVARSAPAAVARAEAPRDPSLRPHREALPPIECPLGTERDTASPDLERCLDPSGLGSGLARHFTPGGDLLAEGRYRGDLREGPWTEWSLDGRQRAHGNYRNGQRDGAWQAEDLACGEVAWRGNYVEGRQDGPWMFVVQESGQDHELESTRRLAAMFEDGRQTSWQVPLPDGGTWQLVREPDGTWAMSERDAGGNTRLRAEVQAPDAPPQWSPLGVDELPTALVLDGDYQELWPNGTTAVRGRYTSGELDGTWETFYPGGQKASERNFAAGVPTGDQRDWYEDGQLAREGQFARTGLPHGRWTTWHANGQRASHGRFEDGLPSGRWTWWYEDGKRQRQGTWRDPDDMRPGRLESVRAEASEPVFTEVALFVPQRTTALPDELPDAAARTAEKLRAIDALLVTGVADGTWEAWHPNGQLSERVNFVRGKRQ